VNECTPLNQQRAASSAAPHTSVTMYATPREAYLAGDSEATKLLHQQRQAQLQEKGVAGLAEQHSTLGGPYLKALVYGGLDGIITTFATVTSVAGADLAAIVIVIVGIAHLFADGISMGLGDALSAQAEFDYNESERAREKWEMQVDINQEVEEMVELYKQRGIQEEDARIIWTTLQKYPQAFLDVMMVEELHILPPDKDEVPWKSGVVTCLAFMAFGLVPLIPYLLDQLSIIHLSANAQLNVAVLMTVATLFMLGVLKSFLVELNQSWYYSGFIMAFLGSLAALISYIIGIVLKNTFNVQ